MTTIKDLLNDFAEEIKAATIADEEENADETFEEAKERLIEEYLDTIKERIVGY